MEPPNKEAPKQLLAFKKMLRVVMEASSRSVSCIRVAQIRKCLRNKSSPAALTETTAAKTL